MEVNQNGLIISLDSFLAARKSRPKSATQKAVEAKVFSLAVKEECENSSEEEEEDEDAEGDLGGSGTQDWEAGDDLLENYLEYEDENIDVRLIFVNLCYALLSLPQSADSNVVWRLMWEWEGTGQVEVH